MRSPIPPLVRIPLAHRTAAAAAAVDVLDNRNPLVRVMVLDLDLEGSWHSNSRRTRLLDFLRLRGRLMSYRLQSILGCPELYQIARLGLLDEKTHVYQRLFHFPYGLF